MSVALWFWFFFGFLCFVRYYDFLFRNITVFITLFKSFLQAFFSPFKRIAIYAGLREDWKFKGHNICL